MRISIAMATYTGAHFICDQQGGLLGSRRCARRPRGAWRHGFSGHRELQPAAHDQLIYSALAVTIAARPLDSLDRCLPAAKALRGASDGARTK